MKAFLKNYRQSPRKVRLVADLIRGKKVDRALTVLSNGDKRANSPLKKLVESASANAQNSGTSKDDLIVKEIQVNEGIVFKRYMPRARGRAATIRKKTSHVSIQLAEQKKSETTKDKKQTTNDKPSGKETKSEKPKTVKKTTKKLKAMKGAGQLSSAGKN